MLANGLEAKSPECSNDKAAVRSDIQRNRDATVFRKSISKVSQARRSVGYYRARQINYLKLGVASQIPQSGTFKPNLSGVARSRHPPMGFKKARRTDY